MQKKQLIYCLAKRVSTYMMVEKNRQEFEKWYFEKYGEMYSWEYGGRSNDKKIQKRK